jgi:site-specific recombinase XerD
MDISDNIVQLPVGQKPKVSKSKKPARKAKKPIQFFTESQVEALMTAIKKISRNPHRDATMIMTCYRHGLRVSELVGMTWEQVRFDEAEMFVQRLKGSKSTTHPIEGDELRALRKLKREKPNARFVFVSEQGGPLSVDSFQGIVKRAGLSAGLPSRAHPHMLRHGTGYYLVNKGYNTRLIQEYLGHKDIRNTELYTQIDARRFRGMWSK